MELTGYTDRLSYLPGDVVTAMVSTDTDQYTARLVRLIHGDENPAGPGLKVKEVPGDWPRSLKGGLQKTRVGSFAVVNDAAPLADLSSFTIQAWIYPTSPCLPRFQGIVARWSRRSESGFALGLAESGRLVLKVGDADGRSEQVELDEAMQPHQWYFVAASFDAGIGVACLYRRHVARIYQDRAIEHNRHELASMRPSATDAPLLIGAWREWQEEEGTAAAGGLFNGKIERPTLFRRALSHEQVDHLQTVAQDQLKGDPDLIGMWDFGVCPAGETLTDASSNDLHGRIVNAPLRAVTSHLWDGRVLDFNQAPAQYAAAHFHDDDLEDARWATAFSAELPQELSSGVYALKLEAGGESDYLPFVVRPRAHDRAPVAVLLPTLTYIAYANEMLDVSLDFSDRGGVYAEVADKVRRALEQFGHPYDAYLGAHPEWGRSLYDTHSDGSVISYSSRLRPIRNMRPTYRHRYTDAPRHFAADLYLIDWLEANGYRYHVLTDDDLDREGADLLSGYRALITGSHPEYVTSRMLDACETFVAGGGGLMYLGGNGFFWVTSIDAERPHLIEVRRGMAGSRTVSSEPGEGYHSTTGEPGGLWRYRGRYPNALVCVGFTGDGFEADFHGYRRLPDSHREDMRFVFEGVDEEVVGAFGLIRHGAAGDEIDRLDYGLGTPRHAVRLASSSHSSAYFYAVEDMSATMANVTGDTNPNVRADIVFCHGPDGGGVFAVGSMGWMGCLSHNGYDNNVSRITNNVLKHFLREGTSEGS